MANRAQRRARNKAQRRTGSAYSTRPEASRSATDQARFNRHADRVAEGRGEWKPGRVDPDGEPIAAAPDATDAAGTASATQQTVLNPNLARKRTWRDWMRFASWVLIALSALAFLIVMWIPSLPMWAIITVSAFFAVGVLSLFVVRGDTDKNPYLDENGTAV